jgi:hypothetical protein
MAKIISKRGQVKSAPQREVIETQISIIELDDGFTPTPEELEHIKRVFESIREQLDAIVGG